MKFKRIIELILKVLVTILILFSVSIIGYYIFKLNVIPKKYLIPICVFVLLMVIACIMLLFKSKNKIIKIILSIVLILISALFIYTTNYFKNTYKFLSNTQVKYDTLTYSVIVLKDSNYNKVEDLNDKKVSYLSDYKENIKNSLINKITCNEDLVDEVFKLIDMLLTGETDSIVLESEYIELAKEFVEDFESKIKIIDNFDIKVKAHKEKSNVKVTLEPFILYISGIDQYGNVNSVRGRSDVNQIMVINPKTNHILIVNTPRDYYVQLAGTTGLRDKLTHAGIYGIDKSIETLENIYEIDINHYIRVNFNTLINVVDVIGGIDVYSDKAFKSFHIKGWTVSKGLNHFDGKQALAYSRERYAYIDGDHHRGRNQQQVIEAIIDKVTKSSTIISKYNSILKSLDKTFQTDMDTNTITSFIRYQIDKMPSWNIESIQVNGFNSYNYTYSMGYNYYLWVMEPDWDSVNVAKTKINEVLNEE